jgi:hypothetical protein
MLFNLSGEYQKTFTKPFQQAASTASKALIETYFDCEK